MSGKMLPEDNTITMLPGELIWGKALETTRLRLIVMIFIGGILTGIILTVAVAIFIAMYVGRPL